MKNRNLIFVTLLSIVTVGIYDIYWAFSTRNELVKKNLDVPSPLIILAPLLALLAIAAIAIPVHLSNSTGNTVTLVNVLSVLFGVVAVLALIPVAVYWVWRYSKAVEKLTKGDLTAEISMVIAILSSLVGLSIVWPIVVQYYYNQTSTKP